MPRGWAGNAPSSDQEAIARILDAADAIVAEQGRSMRLAEVARSLGVTRQTVYRYFPSSDAILAAAAMRSADGYLDRLAAHNRGRTEPVSAMIESLAFTIETLPDDEQIRFLLGDSHARSRATTLLSDAALGFGREILHRTDVDWEAHGFDEDDLSELNEVCMRLLMSFVIGPPHPHRRGRELRRFLARWIGPAIVYPRLMEAIDGLASMTAPPEPASRPRRVSRRARQGATSR